MRQLTLFATFSLTALLALTKPYWAQSDISIAGVVLEADTDQPLQQVVVSAVSEGNTRFSTTDSQGHFVIALPESGRYLLTTSREGMVYARSTGSQVPHEPGTWIQVSAGQQIQDVSLRMVRAGVISGRALDSNGKTFSAVRGLVAVMRNSYDAYGNRGLHQDSWVHFDIATTRVARMDDRGDYRLYGLQPGDYYVQISGGGNHYFYPGTPDEALAQPVHVSAGEEVHLGSIILPAQPNTLVRFHFSDPAGNPLNSNTSGSLILQSRDLSLLSMSFQSAGAPKPASDVRGFSLAPGLYEFVIGLLGTGASSELQYGHVRLNVGSAEIDEAVTMSRGIRVSGDIAAEDANGKSADLYGLVCVLHSDLPHIESTAKDCFGKQFSSGLYQLEVTGMPADAYIKSAEANGKDILAHGLQLDIDTEIKVLIRTLGGKLDGIVKDAAGMAMPEAAVVLVPDEPLRGAGSFYRFVNSDIHGNYQLRGIAPGAYHLFAWKELDGAAYRNAEFMKPFEGHGVPVQIENGGQLVMDIKILAEPVTGQN